MSGEYVIMFATEDAESEIVIVGDVDEIVVSKITIGGDSPMGLWVLLVS